MGSLRALRHHDHEWPAVRVIPYRFGESDLRLPHALGAALAPAVQKKNDRPLLAVVAPPILGQVYLKFVDHSLQFDSAIQEPGILRWLRLGKLSLCRQAGGSAGPEGTAQRKACQSRRKIAGHRSNHHTL